MDPEFVTVEALRLQQLVDVVLHQEGVVQGSGELDVPDVPGAEVGSQATGWAGRFVIEG